MALIVFFTSLVGIVFVSVLGPWSPVWWATLLLILWMDAFALGLTAYLTSSRWGAMGLWIYILQRDVDDVVPAVERGLSGAGVSFVPTARRPTRRYLGKATHAFETPGGGVTWIVPVLREGQFRGVPPETLVAIEDAERISPGELERVKVALARALSD